MPARVLDIEAFASEYKRVLADEISATECFTFLGIAKATYTSYRSNYEGTPNKEELGCLSDPNLDCLKADLDNARQSSRIVQDVIRDLHIVIGKMRKEHSNNIQVRKNLTNDLASLAQLMHLGKAYTPQQIAELKEMVEYLIYLKSKSSQ